MDTAARARIKALIGDCSRLHVGCGFNFVKGWVNVGLFEDSFLPYGEIAERHGLVFHLDVTKDFPFEDGSLSAIYASHFIEHFPFEEGLAMVRRFQSALKPGGVLRLTFPDLELWIRKYAENDAAFFSRYRKFFLSDPPTPLQTKGEIFMAMAHGWGHQWAYDYESMAHLLRLAGFEAALRMARNESAIPDIARVESSWEGRTMETCYVEAVKQRTE